MYTQIMQLYNKKKMSEIWNVTENFIVPTLVLAAGEDMVRAGHDCEIFLQTERHLRQDLTFLLSRESGNSHNNKQFSGQHFLGEKFRV